MVVDYDVVIIGGGPAGLTAAIYTSRANLSTLVIEKGTVGGELVNRELIENYPSNPGGIMGADLASGMSETATQFGAEFASETVEGVEDKGSYKIVHTNEDDYYCYAVIVASGSQPKKLNCEGQEKYDYTGIFYCETCDGAHYAGQDVVVAGGGDSGITGALILSRICTSVTVVEFMESCKASRVLLDRADADPKITILTNTKICAAVGGETMEGVEVEDRATGEKKVIRASGMLVRIGLNPNTDFLEGCLELTPQKFVPVNGNMETAIPGIFAAGDIRTGSPMQVSTAVGDGATAALAAGRFLNSH